TKNGKELAAIGPVLLSALNSPFPTFAQVAWVFRDLGREDEFAVVLGATPIESPLDRRGAGDRRWRSRPRRRDHRRDRARRGEELVSARRRGAAPRRRRQGFSREYFGRAERAEPAAAGLAQRVADALPLDVAEEVVLTGSV